MLRKIALVAGAVSVACCGAASAADIPARTAPVYANPAPVSSWEGFYVGAHGGYASADADVVFGGLGGSGSPKGGFGGLQIGYNYLITPHWLLGYEADASFGDINDSTPPFVNSNFKVDTFGTGRGRFGYVHGPWLLYGTFGMAWARTNRTGGAGVLDSNRALVGWAGGLGVEYAFLPNWSAKVEYLYADFGETRRSFGAIPIDTALTMSMVRAGLNYHFGAPARQVSGSSAEVPTRVATGWTGPYIGLHGGYGSGAFKLTAPVFGTSLDPAGAFGGFQGGYNWQFAPNWVVGLESDSSWGSIKETSGANEIEIDELGTVRGRLGYAMRNVLLYGTGGLAWAHIDSSTAGPIEFDRYMLGWAAGAGVEYKFAPRWSVKVEYAYMNFPEVSEKAIGNTFDDELDVHTVKLGLNYHASLLSLFVN
jgi:outer membrane immunogenic protein